MTHVTDAIIPNVTRMTDGNWKDDYNRIITDSNNSGELDQREKGDDRRHHPRFRLKTGFVWVKVTPRFTVVDVSVSGIAIHSDFPFQNGDVINITLGKAFSVEAEVVNCSLVATDPDFMEAKYLVRCQFEDESIGMQFLVMIKEMDNLDLEMRGFVDRGG